MMMLTNFRNKRKCVYATLTNRSSPWMTMGDRGVCFNTLGKSVDMNTGAVIDPVVATVMISIPVIAWSRKEVLRDPDQLRDIQKYW